LTNIVTALNEGTVSFSYRKADGSTRKATGTTKADLIPESDRASSNANTDTSEQVRYYDIDSKGWRSFSRSALDQNSVKTEAAAG
jgi:hypothetical protein